jgi:hypothetical protein
LPNQFPLAVHGPYRTVTTRGWEYFQSEPEARQIWEAEQPKLLEMFEKERLARGRFTLAVQSIRKFLHANHFAACVIDPRTGVQFPVAPYYWGSDACAAAFELRDLGELAQRPMPRIKLVPSIEGRTVAVQQGYVLIFEGDFVAFLAAADPQSGPTTETGASESLATATAGPGVLEGKQKSKGGRPKLYDTDALVREIVRRANSIDGLPKTRADLQRELAQWCVDHWGAEPSDSQMREYLRRWTPYE